MDRLDVLCTVIRKDRFTMLRPPFKILKSLVGVSASMLAVITFLVIRAGDFFPTWFYVVLYASIVVVIIITGATLAIGERLE